MPHPRRGIKLERRRTGDLPPVASADFIGLGSIHRPCGSTQLFLEKPPAVAGV
jgi:hypothetical protein